MDPRYIHVGSWNIEHFGKEGDDNDENRFAIAEHIEMAGVDVLALQEIYVTDSNNFTNIHLQNALDLIHEHTGHTWEYELFRNRSPNDTSQLCGIAWNTSRLAKVGSTIRIDVDTRVNADGMSLSLWDRIPHAVKFSAGDGRTDIIVISLHMKANTGPRHKVMKQRHEEVKTLMAELPSVIADMGGDEDVVILGDTNCKHRSEDAIQEFVNGGFEDLNEDDIPTYVRGNAPFDRIFIPQSPERKAFRFSRQYILRSASPLSHDRYLSDHYVIKTTVKIRRDDD